MWSFTRFNDCSIGGALPFQKEETIRKSPKNLTACCGSDLSRPHYTVSYTSDPAMEFKDDVSKILETVCRQLKVAHGVPDRQMTVIGIPKR